MAGTHLTSKIPRAFLAAAIIAAFCVGAYLLIDVQGNGVHYAQIRADTGAMRERRLGVTYYRTGDSIVLGALASLEPRIPSQWFTVETDVSNPESNPRLAWQSSYRATEVWAQVDLPITRLMLEDLARNLPYSQGKYPPSIGYLSAGEPFGPIELDQARWECDIQPGWLRSEMAREYLLGRGYLGADGRPVQDGAWGAPEDKWLGRVLEEAGWSALAWHASRGDANAVKVLCESGVDVDDANRAGYTALHLAAQWGRSEVVRILLDHGAALDVGAGGGWTPLMLAAANGWDRAAELLLVAGAAVDESDDQGRTALHWVAMARDMVPGQAGTAQLLLRGGADPNVQDLRSGSTPLHHAVFWERADVAEVLLRGGARADIENESGTTPLDVAMSRSFRIAEILRAHGAGQ